MATHWRFRELLAERDLNPYRLARETPSLTRNTIYRLSRHEPDRIDRKTLDEILGAVERLSGRPVELSELLSYERSEP